MGLAIDTVLGQVTNSVGGTAPTMAQGDSLTVRNFPASASARLEAIIVKAGQVSTASVRSPSFHDNVRGITVISAQQPTQYSLPEEVGQPLQANDTLVANLNSGGANSSIIALQHFYSDLPGASARLHSWGDIMPLIKSIKPIEVDCVANATIGQWSDTLITSTENLLHANTDYAVLGYAVDVACGVVAFRGADTSNYRVGGPGTVLQDTTTDYFIELSKRHSAPHIPVFNAANAASSVVSIADNAASTAVKVQLICAELSQVLPN